ncbi:Telomerase Cajal body protein 1 [Perkinsus olseni]|uniref:Telomerase Cajal body protein 1 n=1 Tax=Perkinsus olseni TaxID=32597 RepID=A0A7J6S2E4_PEROL|nr:Telomerase Cajal body protein 1 [Perkinsus olseni]
MLHQRAPSLSATNPSEGLDQEEADPLNTGVTVWPSSAELASRLIDESGSGGLLDVSGKRVIELGSGCGLGGLACAAADASKVTLTDLPEVLNDVTKRNIGANSVLTWTCDLQAKPLAWPGEDSAELGDCDVVLGADLIYREADVDLLLAAIRNLMKQNNARKFIWMQPSRDPIANAKAMHCFKENHHSVTTVGPDLYVVDLTPSSDQEHPTANDESEAQGTPVAVSEEVHSADESEAVKQGAKRSREVTSEDDTEPTKRSRTRRASVYPGMESYNAAVFTAFEGCAVRSDDDVDGEKSPTSENASD